jgi:regulator of cell morphogenesis and NO signaling
VTTHANLLERPLGEIVTADSRTAVIFDRLGLDYCCHGHQTLADAAATAGIAVDAVLHDIDDLGPANARDAAPAWKELDDLARYIVRRHHGYVRTQTPVIAAYLDKLVARHGERHPELAQVRAIFASLSEEMAAHMMKEENILFPFVELLAINARTGGRLPPGPFGTVMNPVRMMEEDHREAGELLAQVRHLTSAYTPPADGCTTYRLCYKELADFEADLHRHIHLENSVLFPQAVEIERRLS